MLRQSRIITLVAVCIMMFMAVEPAPAATFKKKRTIGPEEFMYLCQSGSAEEITNALRNGASAWIQYKDGTTTLMTAAKSNTPEAVKVLIDVGVNVNAKNSDGNTALLIAAQSNSNPEVIDVLIEAGAEDASNKNAETALMLAARNNNPAVIIALVKTGADASAKSRIGETAFSIAQSRGDYEVINALFNFQELCEKGSPEEILRAINAGIVVSMTFDFDYTPLMIASAFNTAQAVKILIDAGATVNNVTAGDEEESALSLAARQNTLDVINVLLNANVDTLRTVYFYNEETEMFSSKTVADLASENEKLKGTDAVKILRAKMEEQSNAENQVKLGFMYYEGKGVPKDNREAFKWFSRAAEQGNSQAQYVMALFYRDGISVNKDKKLYRYYLQRAADNGNIRAQVLFGDELRKDFVTSSRSGYLDQIRKFLSAFHYYSIAAGKSNSNAMYGLAMLYDSIPLSEPANPMPGLEDKTEDEYNLYMVAKTKNVSDKVADTINTINEFLSLLSMKLDWEDNSRGNFAIDFEHDFRNNVRTHMIKWFREAARHGHSEAQQQLKRLRESW